MTSENEERMGGAGRGVRGGVCGNVGDATLAGVALLLALVSVLSEIGRGNELRPCFTLFGS